MVAAILETAVSASVLDIHILIVDEFVFDDGPAPTHPHNCLNSVSLKLKKRKD